LIPGDAFPIIVIGSMPADYWGGKHCSANEVARRP
jgi:hypothetical protein